MKVKPTAQAVLLLKWEECTEYIEVTHGIKTRDFLDSHSQFGQWCDSKGYGEKDADGVTRSQSRTWFAEYQVAEKSGEIVKRPYQDFWHWLIDVRQIGRRGLFTVSAEMGEFAEPWQQQILALYLSEFGEGPYLTD